MPIMPPQQMIVIDDSSQVGEVRRIAARLAESANFSETQRGEIAIIATELTNNLLRYAKHGKMLLQLLDGGSGVSLELLSIDSGPGIADVQRSLQDGYSTGGSPGTGLGAVKRLSTEFDLHSVPGKGTIVVSRVSNKAQPAPASLFQWAGISIPVSGETDCGDSWLVAERGAEISIMVADGLGHGLLAAEASRAAIQTFDAASFDMPSASLQAAHRALSGTRGAAIAVASGSGQAFRYAGVGNIAGRLLSPSESRGLVSHNGIVGHNIGKVQQLDYPWADRQVLVMHSDGLQSRWDLDGYPGLLSRHPGVIAAVLYRDFVRGRDDATVVVVRPVKAR